MASYKYRIVQFFILLSLGVAGCATVPTQSDYSQSLAPEPLKVGVYHKVLPGETLWEIAKAYNVELTDVIRSNGIPDAAEIEKDQLIFIPGGESVPRVEPGIEEDKDKNQFVWPIQGKIITYFHQNKDGFLNKGIDIHADPDQVVKASRRGNVIFSDYLGGYGHTLILDHEDGFYTVYAQNDKLLVKLGDPVLKNQPIARVGRAGNLAFLHFEIRKNSMEHNPLHYLP